MGWLYIVIEWIIRLVMLVIVPHKRKPGSAMAWLLMIFFFPIAGLIIYILFGNYHLPKRRAARHARLMKTLLWIREKCENQRYVLKPDSGDHTEATIKMAERLSYMPILGGNQAELISQTQPTIDRLIADIDSAEIYVHIMVYIYYDDHTGRSVAEALIRAVKRGVKCRVLVDAVGSRRMLRTLGAELKVNGVDVCASLRVGVFRRTFARIDLRNHRKIFVIDGKIGYAGSQNIINEEYGTRDLVWRDLMVRLEGPAVWELTSVFMEDWFFETDEVLDENELFQDADGKGDVAVQALPSGPNYPTENYQRMVVGAIHDAREHVVITTPYFVPDEAVLQALETAVLSGVKVELIVPMRLNHVLVAAAGSSYYEHLLEYGVDIFQYTGGLLHVKAMCIDDSLVFIGSSNFDVRSFVLNFEINLLLYGREMADKLRKQQQEYINESVKLELDEWRKRTMFVKFWQNTAKLLSPVL